MIEIEKDFPVPERTAGAKPKYPWALMKVGDSFFVPNRTPATLRTPVRFADQGWRFTIRATTNGEIKGTRVWRVK